ncbi:MAG: choice-of-anchor I family protein [Burkholderiaceae bacterium]
MKDLFTLSLLATASILTACGGSSNTTSSQGVFVDAPVEGLSYVTTSGLSGTTNSAGVFNYFAGDRVTFSLGTVNFPTVAAGALVSPLDLVAASSANDPSALAIARLLQSVDSDGNPDNGITVNRAKLASNISQPADWSKVNDTQLAAMLSAGAPGLRSESQARTHLSSQLASINKDPQMSLVGRYASGGTVAAPSLVAEIIAHHVNSKSLFITVDTTDEPSSFKRVDLSGLGTTALGSPTTANNLTVSPRYNVATNVNDASFTAGGVQSLDVTGNLLAIAVQASRKTDPGVIAFYSLSSTGIPSFLKKVTVGSLPDGVAFSPDGKYLVVANEGELSNSFMTDGIDPEGSISIINISNGSPADTAVQVRFTDFNVGGSRASELPSTVRIGRPGATVAQDLEPEYVSISEDSKTAYITLQENNAVAEVDLAAGRVSKIFALGFKDYGSKFKIAASDRYAGTSSSAYSNPTVSATLKNYNNLYGVYLPDGIATYTVNGKIYFLTANEGDDRADFLTGSSADTASFSSIVANLDAIAFPANVVNTIKTDQELGRLILLTKDARGNYGDTDGDGDYDRIYVLGGRSFSIWDASTGNQVFDSGEDVERAAYNNASDDSVNSLALLKASQLLGRLDNKGPEPESLVVGQVGTETYAFLALERASAVMMYKITDPTKPRLVQYIRNTTTLLDGDISPEGMKFIPASQSPTGVALLAVGHEVTGSVAVYQIK